MMIVLMTMMGVVTRVFINLAVREIYITLTTSHALIMCKVA